MLETLIRYITDGAEDRLSEISIEDAALGRVWCAARSDTDRCAEVQTQLDLWLEKHRRPQWDTEGHRHQWVLRDLIDDVRAGRLAALERDELDFLCCVFEMAHHSADRAAYSRVRALLEHYVNELEVRRRELPNTRGLNALAKRVRFLDSAAFENAPHARVRSIAGIEMPSTGPLLRHSGHVKLLGSVPDGCTLVVEMGSCSVMGYVMGRMAVTQHCDVRHNISGVAISGMGGIRARNIIDQAFVVAKAGSVHARRVENPKLLFAGERLVVTDSVRRGRIIAPDIDIRQEVLGGCIHVSRCLSGNLFRATPSLPLSIVFRKRLTGGDFGGVRTREAARLHSQVLRLKTRILTLEALIRSVEREVKHHAETALYFLYSTSLSQQHAERIRRDKSRLEVLDRIIEGLLGLAYGIAERAAERATAHADAVTQEADEATVMFKVADTLLLELDRTITGQSDVHGFIARISDIREGFRNNVPGSRLAAASLGRIRAELTRWLEQREELVGQIKQSETALRSQLDTSGAALSAAELQHPERALRRILDAARQMPQDSSIARRASLPFISAMRRTAEKRCQVIEEYRGELIAKREEFERKASELRTRHQINVALEEPDSGQGPRVTGRFEGGVVIYADVPAWEQQNAVDPARFIVPDTGEVFKSYQRRFTHIVEAGS